MDDPPRRARGDGLIALLAWAVSRPSMQDAVSLSLGLAAPPPGGRGAARGHQRARLGDRPGGDGRPGGCARTARTTNVLLRSVRDDLRAETPLARTPVRCRCGGRRRGRGRAGARSRRGGCRRRPRPHAAAVRARAHDLPARARLESACPDRGRPRPDARRCRRASRRPGAVSATYAWLGAAVTRCARWTRPRWGRHRADPAGGLGRRGAPAPRAGPAVPSGHGVGGTRGRGRGGGAVLDGARERQGVAWPNPQAFRRWPSPPWRGR